MYIVYLVFLFMYFYRNHNVRFQAKLTVKWPNQQYYHQVARMHCLFCSIANAYFSRFKNHLLRS